ncbi:MAG: hypothetical protein RR337_12345 [Clostridia bacterium]
MLEARDREALRRLGAQLHDIAQLPQQKETIELWKSLNDLHMQRPLLTIDQEPWHEMNFDGSLTLEVQDQFWRAIEKGMRQTIFKWKYYPADMVVEDCVRIPKAIEDTGFGLEIDEKTAVTDEKNDVVGHAYIPTITCDADIDRIQNAVVTHHCALSKERMDQAHEIFDGIIPVKASGVVPRFDMWDQLVERMGVTQTLYNLVDEPEFIHHVCARWLAVSLDQLDQYERLNLLDATLPTCHCTYTYNRTLESALPAPDHVSPSSCWTNGMAQIFANVGPRMHETFELMYARHFYERFGYVNYGCCEPLHDKIDMILRYIPNARKISISPWAKVDVAAAHIGRRAVLCRKPNPTYLSAAGSCWEESERELRETLAAAKRNHCAVEFVLKDLSSLGYQPQRLFEWEKRAMAIMMA